MISRATRSSLRGAQIENLKGEYAPRIPLVWTSYHTLQSPPLLVTYIVVKTGTPEHTQHAYFHAHTHVADSQETQWLAPEVCCPSKYTKLTYSYGLSLIFMIKYRS